MKRVQATTVTSLFKKAKGAESALPEIHNNSKPQTAEAETPRQPSESNELACAEPEKSNEEAPPQNSKAPRTEQEQRISTPESQPSRSRSASPRSSWTIQEWSTTLSSRERELLELEIQTMDHTWLAAVSRQLTSPYYLSLKEFLHRQEMLHKTIFPPSDQIFSWTRHTPLDHVRVVILGQDPYHNYNQAHGLAFSVNPPTPAPPSLVNIFKELESCYPDTFKRPKDKGGLLLKWADQGVLMLNTCLTVEAHKANSHANKGWETFTEKVLRIVLEHNPNGVCFMVWGSPAAKRLERIKPGPENLILKSVHPSPLSASRGWFGSKHFLKANEWLEQKYNETINWSLE